jgi:cytochrome c5
MRTWQLALAAPVLAAAVCTTARHTQAPAAPAVDGSTAQPLPQAPAATVKPPSPDFERDVKPILERQCRPCHFTGGVMYEKLPFDRAETIKTLGERLFTRIKAAEDQAVIRTFLNARN